MLKEKEIEKVKAVGATYVNEFSFDAADEISFGSIKVGVSSVESPTELACLLIEKAEMFGREAAWKRVSAGEKVADAIADTARARVMLTGFAIAIMEAFDLRTTLGDITGKRRGIRIEHSAFCTKVSFYAAPDTSFLVSAHGDSLPERMRDAARWSRKEEYNSVLHECHERGLCVETAWKAHILCERMAYCFRQGLSAAFLGVPKAS